jgi:hypothetical protein
MGGWVSIPRELWYRSGENLKKPQNPEANPDKTRDIFPKNRGARQVAPISFFRIQTCRGKRWKKLTEAQGRANVTYALRSMCVAYRCRAEQGLICTFDLIRFYLDRLYIFNEGHNSYKTVKEKPEISGRRTREFGKRSTEKEQTNVVRTTKLMS